MRLSTHLNDYEIKEALRRYVSQELGVEVKPSDAVRVNMHRASGNDPREYDYFDAVVEYTK